MEKGDVLKYSIIGLVFLGLVVVLFVLRGGPTGYAVYFEGPGEGQTTLMLQTADSDNLGDTYVSKGNPNKNYGDVNELKVQRVTWQRGYLKFNISAIPDNQIMDNASLCLYLFNDQGSQTISANHVYDDSWCEGDGGTDGSPACEITWNNQPCGTETESLDSNFCNTTAESNIITDKTLDNTWQCWNVINMVRQEYDSDNESISLVLWTVDTGSADKFYSKEYTDVSLRPYLNVTYHSVNTAPVIDLVSPQDGATYGYNESLGLDFSASDSDDNLDSCWYNIDEGDNVSLAGCANTIFDVAGNGDYVLNIYVNDSFGEEASDSAGFSVEVGAPTILLHFPIDEYLNYQENIYFNYTATDVDLDSCWLWGDFDGEFKINQTDSSPDNGSMDVFVLNLSDNEYLWNIECNDSAGNSAVNGNKTFYVDIVAPFLSLSEPSGGKSSRTVSAVWSVSDANLDSCWYNVYQGAGLHVGNTFVNCSDNSASFDVSADGSFVFNFYINDFAGNSNSANSSFSVDTSTPSGSPGGGSGGGGGSGSVLPSTNKLQISEIGEIIAYSGEKKTLLLNVKNVRMKFLNNCRLVGKGEIGSWVYSDKVVGIALGESVDFVFDLNVPEEIGAGDYSGELEIKCDEGISVQNISVSVPGLGMVNIKNIIYEKNVLKIDYDFDNSNVIGDSASMDIWIANEEGVEVKRVQDVFSINKDGLIERSVEIDVGDLGGIYYVYFALSSDLDNFARKSVVLGESRSTTGFAVFDTLRGKTTIYVIFIIVVAIGVYFIWKRHGKTKHRVKSKWLLRKKK